MSSELLPYSVLLSLQLFILLLYLKIFSFLPRAVPLHPPHNTTTNTIINPRTLESAEAPSLSLKAWWGRKWVGWGGGGGGRGENA